MAFILKSAFWLGIVYSAMPLGETQTRDFVPAQAALLCNEATAFLALQREADSFAQRIATAKGCSALSLAASLVGNDRGGVTALQGPPGIAATSPVRVELGGAEPVSASDRRLHSVPGPPPRWPSTAAKRYKRETHAHIGSRSVDD